MGVLRMEASCKLLLVTVLANLVVGPCLGGAPPPVWSRTYSVEGTLSIPYAEIEEPFAAWADLDGGKSRIDYYDGMVKTFQRADVKKFGTMAKIIPMTNEEVINKIDCFGVDGEEGMKIEPQSMLPDVSDFELLGQELKGSCDCQKWQKIEKIGEKTNKYTIWVDMTGDFPVPRHYDHYFISYQNFSPDKPANEVFDLFLSKSCHGWPGPGKASDHVYTMNPAKEFVDNHDAHVRATFEEFETKHGKVYSTAGEREARVDLYRQNLRFIHSKNRQGLTFSLASNHLADRTDSEIHMLRGLLHDPQESNNGGLAQEYTQAELDAAPDTLDWRLYGAVTPVKDQSVCGSCWSFGTVGTLEGTLFLQTGNLVRLSQQALVDCSWGFGNNGCDGGEDFRAYQWMLAHGGIPTEDSYGPCLGQDGYCRADKATVGLKIKGWVNVTSGSTEALKVAIASRGPVSVAIDAGHKSLSFYSHGVYYEPECSSTDLDHAVLAVGYGTIGGEDYWLVKNSWSTYWGNDGYVLMSQKNNNCGVATDATYVLPDMRGL